MSQFLRPSAPDGHRSHSRSRRSREPTPEPGTRRKYEEKDREPRSHYTTFDDRSRRPTTPQPRPRHARIHSWPPSPLVEDEALSLAKEANSSQLLSSDVSEAVSRGSPEQQPIILEVYEVPSADRARGNNLTPKTSKGRLRDPERYKRPPLNSRQNSKEARSSAPTPGAESQAPPELSSRQPSTYSYTPKVRNGSQTSVTDSGYYSSSETRSARDAEKRKAAQGPRDNVMSDALRGQGKSREGATHHRRVPSGPYSDVGRTPEDAARVLSERLPKRYSYTRGDLDAKESRATAKDMPTKLTEAKAHALHATRRNSDTETTLPRSHPDDPLRAAAAAGAAGGVAAAAYSKSGRHSTSRPSSPAPSSPRSPRPDRPHYKDDPPYGGRTSRHGSAPSSREGSRASSPNRFDHPRRTSTFPIVPDDRTQRTSRLMTAESTPESEPCRTPSKKAPPTAALPYPVDDMNLMPSEADHRYRPRPLDSSTTPSLPAHKEPPPMQPMKRDSLNAGLAPTRPRLNSRHTVNTSDLPTLTTGSGLPTPGSASFVESPVSTRGFELITPPPCPRPESSRKYTDWYTLANLSTFDICPPCYTATFLHTPFRTSFKLAAPKDIKRRCDFASPWIRIAWLATQAQKRTDLDLLYNVARVGVGESCPGDDKETRTWYTILDKHGDRVDDFNVCSTDVRRVEALMPALTGLFTRNHHGVRKSRKCDFRVQSGRFEQYLNALIATSDVAEKKRRPPDMAPFGDLVRLKAAVPECRRDQVVADVAWHFPPSVPDVTVCEECYVDVVWPAIAEGSSVASRFGKTPFLLDEEKRRGRRSSGGAGGGVGGGAGGAGGISCQLYSERMRKVFRKAVATGDFEYLVRRVMERRKREVEVRAKREMLERLAREVERKGMRGSGETSGLRERRRELEEEWRWFE